MRRNTILALSTVVAMAVIAALFIWGPFGGGSDALDNVTVSDDEIPTVTVDGAVEISDIETKVITEGDGAELGAGDYFRANYIFADGATGDTLESTFGDETTGQPAQTVVFEFTDATAAASQTTPGLPEGLLKALEGTTVGSKVVVGLTGEDFFGADTYEQAEQQGMIDQIPYERDEVLLFYLEVEGSIDVDADPTPQGTEQELPAGVPSPVVDGDDVTGLDGAGATEPATEAVHPVIVGDGAEVEADDYVFANYVGQVYPSGAVFDSSFTRDAPSLFPLTGVIACWTDMLTGQTVGSRVVLTCPADVAYGDQGGGGGAIAPGDSLTFVVDIVAAL